MKFKLTPLDKLTILNGRTYEEFEAELQENLVNNIRPQLKVYKKWLAKTKQTSKTYPDLSETQKAQMLCEPPL